MPPRSNARLAPLIACAFAALAPLSPAGAESAEPAVRVRIDTTLGSFTIELDALRAPLTSANFLSYARTGHYDGTLFHRVINSFVVQGGGYDDKQVLRATRAGVANESGNGLSNKRGTVGLARSDEPHSGNAQFYVNLNDNEVLDPSPLRWGYTVFGRIVEGMDVVDRIGHTPTGSAGIFPRDTPLEPVVIRHAEVIGGPTPPAAPAAPPAPPASPPPATPPAR